MEADHIQRLAKTGNALRPDWPVNSLVTFLGKHFPNRAYADVALVLTKVATDSANETPRLMLEDWPWKVCAPVRESEAARHTSATAWSQLCDHCARTEAHCQSPVVQAEDPHEFTTAALKRARAAKTKPADDEPSPHRPLIEAMKADIAIGRQALASDEAEHAERQRGTSRRPRRDPAA